MRILYVTSGDDYAALEFEDKFGGRSVSELMDNLTEIEETIDDIDVSVIEVGEVDPRFINFVRSSVQDYDDSKHSNFYLEGEVVGSEE